MRPKGMHETKSTSQMVVSIVRVLTAPGPVQGGIIVAVIFGALMAWGQAVKSSQNPNAPAQSNTQDSGSNLPPTQLDGGLALHHLNQLISWYRHSTTGIPSVGLPSDTIYQDNVKRLGSQAIQLAFQSAKAEAAIIRAQNKGNGEVTARESSQQQALTEMLTKISGQIDQLQ